MIKILLIFFTITALPVRYSYAQEPNWDKFKFLIGNWSGTGEGFSSGQSNAYSSFDYLMGNKYIKVTNQSNFGSTDENPKESSHEDLGYNQL